MDSRTLLARILDSPNLGQVIPRLQPEVLQRVIARCGLEDCGELVALATPGQLAAVFDLDLWRSDQPGLDEQFDPERFGVWMEVLVECGPAVAAHALAGLDPALVIAALAQHVRVFDPATLSPSGERDGDDAQADRDQDSDFSCDVGGYHIVARRAEAWDATVAALIALDAGHGPAFHRVMRGCRALSNSAPEVDGLDELLTAPQQVMFDLGSGRERRREERGYATPADARAFLQMSRQLRPDQLSAAPTNAVVAAYFRAIDQSTSADATGPASHLPAPVQPPAPQAFASAASALVELLVNEGVLPQPPRALLNTGEGRRSRLECMQTHMQFAQDHDPAAHLTRSQELMFLANTLVAGCSIQARPFTLQEASDAAVAVCNLGLEHWPTHWLVTASRREEAAREPASLPEGFLVGQDLVAVFQVGWSVLYQRACMYAAERLIGVLATFTCDDREVQAGIGALRKEMTQHWRAGAPWRARDALDVILSLDMPAWAVLLGLMDECPVIHAAVAASSESRTRAVSASAFEFISETSQIAAVREFMQTLPNRLSGV